jgi:transposase
MLALDVFVTPEHRSTVRVSFTAHALDRLAERCWQHPSLQLSRSRLHQISEHVRIETTRPEW